MVGVDTAGIVGRVRLVPHEGVGHHVSVTDQVGFIVCVVVLGDVFEVGMGRWEVFLVLPSLGEPAFGVIHCEFMSINHRSSCARIDV